MVGSIIVSGGRGRGLYLVAAQGILPGLLQRLGGPDLQRHPRRGSYRGVVRFHAANTGGFPSPDLALRHSGGPRDRGLPDDDVLQMGGRQRHV